MKTIVITGSARGFGYAMAEVFLQHGCQVILSDIQATTLNQSTTTLQEKYPNQVASTLCDVTQYDQLIALWDFAVKTFGQVDIWINNAGVNQPDQPIANLTQKEIDFLLNVDLKGAIYGSQIAFARMQQQGFGQIYNVEGYGSNDAMMTGLSLYGTSKRAITYFTQALAKESDELTKGKVCVCRLTPGIMITDFLRTANGGDTAITLPEKTKKVYNILGDYPETIAQYSVPRMLANTKNNRKIVWLTSGRAMGRFFGAMFHKRQLF